MNQIRFQSGTILPREFYAGNDVTRIARDMLGKVLCSSIEDHQTSGVIVETEAYCGRNDKACHANNGLRTERTEVMYGPPGHSYVYLCYGIHHLFNVVTNRKDIADAVLIRAIEPIEGIGQMIERRGRGSAGDPVLTNGPGKLTQALGITVADNRTDLCGERIWIEDRSFEIPETEIGTGLRIGVDYAGKDADRPWRYYMKRSSWVSC